MRKFHKINCKFFSGYHWCSWWRTQKPGSGRAVHGSVRCGSHGETGSSACVEGCCDQHPSNSARNSAYTLQPLAWLPGQHQLWQETGTDYCLLYTAWRRQERHLQLINFQCYVTEAFEKFTRICEGNAQVINHWLIAMEARFTSRAIHVGFVVDKVVLEQAFLFISLSVFHWCYIHPCVMWGTDFGAISGCSSTDTWCHSLLTIIIRSVKMRYGHKRRVWISGLHLKLSSFSKNLQFYQLLTKLYCILFLLLARILTQALTLRRKPFVPCWSSICMCVPTKFKWLNFVSINEEGWKFVTQSFWC